jgi:hypothetical protein
VDNYFNIPACCKFLKCESRILRLVPDKYLSEAVLETASYIRSNPAAKHHHIRIHMRRWLKRSTLPWWVVVLIKLALDVLISLLLKYLKPVSID